MMRGHRQCEQHSLHPTRCALTFVAMQTDGSLTKIGNCQKLSTLMSVTSWHVSNANLSFKSTDDADWTVYGPDD